MFFLKKTKKLLQHKWCREAPYINSSILTLHIVICAGIGMLFMFHSSLFLFDEPKNMNLCSWLHVLDMYMHVYMHHSLNGMVLPAVSSLNTKHVHMHLCFKSKNPVLSFCSFITSRNFLEPATLMLSAWFKLVYKISLSLNWLMRLEAFVRWIKTFQSALFT